MPLIGEIPARGLTTVELTHSVAAKLQQGYVRDPHVAVEVAASTPQELAALTRSDAEKWGRIIRDLRIPAQ